MDIIRNLIATLCILYGAITIVGYFMVIMPNGNALLLDVILSFSFALLFIAGGILAIQRKFVAIPALALSCIIYLVAGLYHPIIEFGISSVTSINSQFYYSLMFRLSATVALFVIIQKQVGSHAQENT